MTKFIVNTCLVFVFYSNNERKNFCSYRNKMMSYFDQACMFRFVLKLGSTPPRISGFIVNITFYSRPTLESDTSTHFTSSLKVSFIPSPNEI